MSNLLAGKTAVVTGGASGIGRATARTFADEGADVVVADVRETPREGGTPTHEVIAEETDADVAHVDCDVTDRADLESAIGAADGMGGVDVLVNNAGLLVPKPFLKVTEEEYDRMMEVNLKGPFFASQLAAERMLEDECESGDGTGTGGGTIINLSSGAGLSGLSELSVYCSSKGAVRLLTYALAAELGPRGIRVNAIHPGIVETMQAKADSTMIRTEEDARRHAEQIPLRRIGKPQDVADTALVLASDLADYVNGESVVVDGGMYNTV